MRFPVAIARISAVFSDRFRLPQREKGVVYGVCDILMRKITSDCKRSVCNAEFFLSCNSWMKIIVKNALQTLTTNFF